MMMAMKKLHDEGDEAYLNSVRHHGHFVECGLPVEDDEVVVSHMPLHFVADLKVEIRRLRMISA